MEWSFVRLTLPTPQASKGDAALRTPVPPRSWPLHRMLRATRRQDGRFGRPYHLSRQCAV